MCASSRIKAKLFGGLSPKREEISKVFFFFSFFFFNPSEKGGEGRE